MAEHYDPQVPSEERRQFAEWFAVCFQAVDADGKFDLEKAVRGLEALRKA